MISLPPFRRIVIKVASSPLVGERGLKADWLAALAKGGLPVGSVRSDCHCRFLRRDRALRRGASEQAGDRCAFEDRFDRCKKTLKQRKDLLKRAASSPLLLLSAVSGEGVRDALRQFPAVIDRA